MPNLTVTTAAAPLPAELTSLAEKAQGYAEAASSANTRRAYAAGWTDFATWCEAKQLEALPADAAVVGLYLTDRASTLKLSSLRIRLVAISQVHKAAGHRLDTSAPQIRKVMQGIARTHGSAVRKVEAATIDVVRDTVRALAKRTGLKALRDRAVVLLGFAAALRRSEISAIDCGHIRFTADGLILVLPRRKTDQEGVGTEIGVPFGKDPLYCPVLVVKGWLEAAGLTAGPLFVAISKAGRPLPSRLGDRDVARVIKAAVAAAGYEAEIFGGHSLRSGFATTAGRAGVAERIIMLQTGHKSLPVLRGYIRRGSLFTENAAALIGL